MGNAATASERREHTRVGRVKMAVRFRGDTYATTNWSMGGFYIEGYDGPLSTGSLITVESMGPKGGHMREVNLSARVVRTSDNRLAVNFLNLDFQAYDLLQETLIEMGELRPLID